MPVLFDNFSNLFQEGLSGRNKGLPTGFNRLEKILNGIHKARYYTLFAESGVGKSSYAWNVFALNPLDYMITHNLKIDKDANLTEEQKKARKIKIVVKLYSLEVIAEEVIAKLICLKIYKDYGLIVSPDYILNRIEGFKVSATMQALIMSYKSYFEFLESKGFLEIIDVPKTPSEIKRDVTNYAKANGTFYKNEKGEERYKPNNPNEYVLIITDTVGNLVNESVDGKTSVKTTIDLHSANCRYYYRDCLRYTPINISHSNRSMSDISRSKLGEVFPKLSDIKETNMLEQDSSVVMTLFNPMGHIATCKALEKFMDYDILKLKENFRCIGILKNRHGQVNKRVGLLYVGACAHFEELPKATEMTGLDYARILNLREAMYMKDEEVLNVIKIKNQTLYNTIIANK